MEQEPEHRQAGGVRDGFWSAVSTADAVLSSPALAGRWSDASVLPELSIGELAAHLVRAARTLVSYLPSVNDAVDRPAISAAEYFVAMVPEPFDLGSSANEGVRQRSREDAKPGHGGVLDGWHEAIAAGRETLGRLGGGELITVAGGHVLRLDEYLRTRTVELVVHTDDLALSSGLEPPEPSAEAASVVAHTLLEVARLRHGDLSVVRAMTRDQRQSCDVLRVF